MCAAAPESSLEAPDVKSIVENPMLEYLFETQANDASSLSPASLRTRVAAHANGNRACVQLCISHASSRFFFFVPGEFWEKCRAWTNLARFRLSTVNALRKVRLRCASVFDLIFPSGNSCDAEMLLRSYLAYLYRRAYVCACVRLNLLSTFHLVLNPWPSREHLYGNQSPLAKRFVAFLLSPCVCPLIAVLQQRSVIMNQRSVKFFCVRFVSQLRESNSP